MVGRDSIDLLCIINSGVIVWMISDIRKEKLRINYFIDTIILRMYRCTAVMINKILSKSDRITDFVHVQMLWGVCL